MSDTLQASPSIAWLLEAAKRLRSAPQKLASASPVLGTLANQAREFLTEPISRGLEHYAYGDKFLDGTANTPIIGQKQEDMLAAAPFGALSSLGKGATAAALYAGAKRPNLQMSHSAHPNQLLHGGDLPREMYNLSLGIKDDALMSEFGPVTLIPKLGKFDPADSPTSLHSFDAYTPRRGTSAGGPVDELLNFTGTTTIPDTAEIQRVLREGAGARLADKFVGTFKKGGLGAEVTGMKSRTMGLPEYGQGGYRIGDSPMIWQRGNPDALHTRKMSYGHRFQSLKDYENLPSGADRLSTDRAEYLTGYRRLADWVRRNPEQAQQHGIKPLDLDVDRIGGSRAGQMLKSAVEGAKGGHFTPAQIGEAREIVKVLRSSRADYGEAKAWGATQLNPSNFAGIIADKRKVGGETLRLLEAAAKRRGLQFDAQKYDPLSDQAAQVARQMQKYAQESNVSITRGRAALQPRYSTGAIEATLLPPGDGGALKKLQKTQNMADFDDNELEWLIANMPELDMFNKVIE